MAARSGGKVPERLRKAYDNLAGVAPRLRLARAFIKHTDPVFEGGVKLPEGMDPDTVRDHPALMAALLSVSFVTWASPHGDADDETDRAEHHIHTYLDIWPEIERFEVMRGFAREIVWADSATAVGIMVGGLDLGGEYGTFAERIASAKIVAQGIQAGTIDATRDLPAVAYLTSTDRDGVCSAAAFLDLNGDDKLVITRWNGEDYGGEVKPPLKLDVWSPVGEVEANDEG